MIFISYTGIYRPCQHTGADEEHDFPGECPVFQTNTACWRPNNHLLPARKWKFSNDPGDNVDLADQIFDGQRRLMDQNFEQERLRRENLLNQ